MRPELGHVTSEGEYFHLLDAELIDKLRKRANLEEQRCRLAEASQIHDPRLLDALERLGFNATTVPLLYLVPLVHMAWADGWVSHAERHRLLAIASLHGLKESTVVYQQLVAWLDQPPSVEFFKGTLRVIQSALELLPPNERQAREHVLIQGCLDIASAAGWHLGRIGVAERALLEEMQKQLEPQQEVAASAGV